jgi:hypothetical protein
LGVGAVACRAGLNGGSGMRRGVRHAAVACGLTFAVLAPALFAQPASAFPPGDAVYTFKYKVVATTFVKKANLTITPPPGLFTGGIDLSTGRLKGDITLPPSTFTQSESGVGVVTATAALVPVKPVTGHVNLGTFKVTATSVFYIHIVSMYSATPPVTVPSVTVPKTNLVGDSCTTRYPVTVTMSGIASLGAPSTFKGIFAIPLFENCEGMTTAINRQISGFGNTFSATATPS